MDNANNEAAAEMETTFEVSAVNMGYLETRIAELQARAVKLAFTVAIGFEILRHFVKVETRTDLDGTTYEIAHRFAEVRVFGEAPRFEGWSLVGRLDFVAIPGATLRAMVPGEECPAEFHNVESTRCDACNVSRRRNDVFVLRHEDARTVVVGRSCLKDYLGHVSPQQIAALAEFLADVSAVSDPDADGYCGGSLPEVYDAREVLAFAANSIRLHGWAPSRDDRSTRDAVVSLMVPPYMASRDEVAAWHAARAAVNASDYAKADKCAAWLETVTPDGDYMHNLKAIIGAAAVGPKGLGIAVSGILAFDRANDSETKRRERAASKAGSVHVGAVKARQEWRATVSNIRVWDGQWGETTFVEMMTAEGNVLIWKASNAPELYLGDVLTFKGTVKAHDTYKGIAQTVLTRCAKVEVAEAGPDRVEG